MQVVHPTSIQTNHVFENFNTSPKQARTMPKWVGTIPKRAGSNPKRVKGHRKNSQGVLLCCQHLPPGRHDDVFLILLLSFTASSILSVSIVLFRVYTLSEGFHTLRVLYLNILPHLPSSQHHAGIEAPLFFLAFCFVSMSSLVLFLCFMRSGPWPILATTIVHPET